MYPYIIRPHRSNMHVDAAYCYLLTSVVCRSVGRSVTPVSPSKTAELIEVPFALSARVGPGNRVLDEGPDLPWEGEILRGKGRPIVK